MAESELISVLMPVRNAGQYLLPAVNSILKQSYSELELIVIDDHSDDGALRQLPPDPRIRVYGNEGDGLVDALNTGIACARGQFIARMDADDIAHPKRLAKQRAYLQAHPQVAICGTQVKIFTDEGLPDPGFRYYEQWINDLCSPEAIHRELYIESPIPHPSAMFRKSVFEQLEGYRHQPWAEDYDLWLRADAAGMEMGKVPELLLFWRDWPARTSRTDDMYALKRFQQAKAFYLSRRYREATPLYIWGAGKTGKILFDCLNEYGCAIEGFIEVHPRRVGGEVRGRPVSPVEAIPDLVQGMILVAIGAKGVREKVRQKMREFGRTEGNDFLFVA
jgi:glycosyltransferase involved in cell wall biosynthesis